MCFMMKVILGLYSLIPPAIRHIVWKSMTPMPRKLTNFFFDMEYTDILFESIGIVIHDDSGCIIYNWEGKLKFEGDFREYISCLIPSGNIAKYTIVTEDGIQVIELH